MAKKRVNVYELKDLRNPILRKKAEKKFKKMKNPKDYDNPDYYERKKGGKVTPPARPGKIVRSKTGRGKTKPQKAMPSPGLMGLVGPIVKKPMGGKVYKVDNSGQNLVQKMYGGKIKWEIKY